MYNKYRFIMLSIFGLSFIGFSFFFNYTFKLQRTNYENIQFSILDRKRNLIVDQVTDMIVKNSDWNMEKSFYRTFIIGSVEKFDGIDNTYAIAYDDKLNQISTRTPGEISSWYYAHLEFGGMKKLITSKNKGSGFLIKNTNTVFPSRCKQVTNISNKDKLYFNWAWIPSVDGEPRYLIILAVTPDTLEHSDWIFVFGATAMMIVYVILFGIVVYMLKVIKLRASSNKEQDIAYRLNDRRKS